jgi:hypothetical protein
MLGTQVLPDYREIFNRLLSKARVHAKMPDAMIERRLRGYVADINQ